MKRAVLIVLALMVCASMALAQGGPPPGAPGPGPGGPGGPGGNNAWRSGQTMMFSSSPSAALNPPSVQFVTRGATALSLTQEQTTKLTDILTKSDATLAPLRKKLTDTSTALRNAVIATTYDAAKVKQLMADAQAAETALLNAELQTWLDVRAVLTADQLGKLQSTLGQRGSIGMGNTRIRNRPGGSNPPPAGPPPAPAPAPVN